MNLWNIIREHPGYALAGVGVGLSVLVRVLYWVACGLQAVSDAADRSFVFPPFRVRLEASQEDQWTEAPAVRALHDELQRLGYADAGTFRIWEMPDTKLLFLVQTEMRVTAVVYRMADKVWMDLKARFEDGSSLTMTNAGMGASLQARSGHPVVRQAGATAEQLHERMLAECAGKPLLPAVLETVATQFQDDYAALAAWQAERGGCSAEEIQGEVVASGARKLDAWTLAYFREKHAANALSNWWRGQPNPPFPWEEVKDHLIIVHDELSLESAALLYGEHDDELSEKDIPSQITSAREAFAALNVNPNGLCPYTKVWEKTTPLAADFYLVFDTEEQEQAQAA